MVDRSAQPQFTTYQFRLNGELYSARLKKSIKARLVRIQISKTEGLTIVVPHRFKIQHLPEILEARKKWIIRHVEALRQETDIIPECRFGCYVNLMGDEIQVVRGLPNGSHNQVIREDGCLKVGIAGSQKIEEVIEKWYRSQARIVITARAVELGKSINATYSRLTIRNQRTRWASCSRSGTLSFNWRIISLPLPVLDYVIIHELCHTREMNHSPAFWKLVEKHCPDWKACRKYLKTCRIDGLPVVPQKL